MQIKEINVSRPVCFNIGQQYDNENMVVRFIGLPDTSNKYLYYKISNLEKEIPLISDMFVVSKPLTLYSGEVQAQIIGKEPNGTRIALSPNFTMRIQPSNYSGIGEDENYPDDPNIKNYYVKIDGKIQSMDELIALVQSKLDNGEFVGAQGPKGEKGDPGDVTEEYRNLANQIAQNASDAQASATNAQTSESNTNKVLEDAKTFASQTKSELNQIKTDMSELKDEASTSATNAKASEDKAKEYADKLQASTDDISQLKEDLVANQKEDAKTKRSLSALWDLNNGISYRFETDSEKAYQKKVPSGAKLGSVNKVGGKTIVMNQYTNIEGVETIWGQNIGNSERIKEISNHKIYVKHKYLIKKILNDSRDTYIKQIIINGDSIKKIGETILKKEDIVVGKESEVSEIIQAPNNVTGIRVYNIGDNTIGLSVVCDTWVNVIDLTKMFGSGNEPSTPEEFEAMFPNDYYPYNEGTLMSMPVNEVVEYGKNVFDYTDKNNFGINVKKVENGVITTNTATNAVLNIPTKVGKTYTLSFKVKALVSNTGGLRWSLQKGKNQSYSQDGLINMEAGFVGNTEYNGKATFTADSEYVSLCTIMHYVYDVQFEEGSTNTTYSPYHEKAYPIPQAIQSLDGYGWSTGTAYNYVDFENKKYYKCVDRINLDEYEYSRYQSDKNPFYYTNRKINGLNITKNILSTNQIIQVYHTATNTRLYYPDGTILDETNKPRGYLYYELAEPIVTDISDIIGDTFQEPFDVESGGSLTFKNTNGDGYQIAVPSDIQYVVALSEVNS